MNRQSRFKTKLALIRTVQTAWIPLCFLLVLTISLRCRAEDPSSHPNNATDSQNELAQQINAFSRKLYRTAAETESTGTNLFLSPLSIHAALTMTFAGSDGADRKKMGNALHLDPNNEHIGPSYKQLLNTLQTDGSGVRMNVGNVIRTAPGTNLSNDYVQTMSTYFSASVASLSGDPSTDASQVNRWVSDQTNGVIDQLVTPDDLRQAFFLLLNAVHFNGNWTEKFDETNTRPAPFHLMDGSTTTVPMMQRTGPYAMINLELDGANGTLLRLPYGPEERFGMMLFLPAENQKIKPFFSSIHEASKTQWETWINKLQENKTRIQLNLPRFDLTFGATSLTPYLNKLGFPLQQVNLNRMGLGSVERLRPIHKATVTVNEDGTEAAGATGVVGVTSVPPTITVNRPFFFLIRDQTTQTILFMGTVYHPTR